MSMPGVIFPDLILVEPDFVLCSAEAFFDGPAGTGHVHEFTESGVTRVVAMVEREFAVVDESSDHVFVVGVGGGYQRPVVDAESFAADSAGSALPRGVVEFARDVLNLSHPSGGVVDRGGLRYRHHVADARGFQVGAESGVLPEFLVGREPGERHASGPGCVDHLDDLLWPGLELGAVGDAGLVAARLIVQPGLLRQVQSPVQQHPIAVRGDLGQECSDLAVVDPAQRSGILPLHSDGFGALFGETGRVGDQNC